MTMTQATTTPKKGHGYHERRESEETIILPDNFKEQMKRMLLLLGASEAGNKDANLNEFTSILDTFRNNKKLSKNGYQILLQRFHNREAHNRDSQDSHN